MKLLVYFRGLCTFVNECLNFLQLTLVSRLKPRRIMENELRVALKGEWAIDILEAALINGKIK